MINPNNIDIFSDIFIDEENNERCTICEEKLVKRYERGEAWGAPYIQTYWECPNCD